MPYINSTKFGEIVIDGKKYYQVLIIGNEVEERQVDQLETLFGTTHEIGDWERKRLLKGNPEIILIGTGQSGVMKVKKELVDYFRQHQIEVISATTSEIIQIYEQKTKEGRKVNALIHTTC
ncbi:MAG: MTH938/NDUFAF3 family protein [Patescibacteria group bacterium]|nr:MTH938/NDUFAF3 family protein [Patescibacteria group bacterium]